MTFADVKNACDRFAQLLLSTTSRAYVSAISVEEPTGVEDELHFVKLVLWSYAFWFEASHPAGKHVASLLRTANPSDHRAVEDTFRAVHTLRTVRAHNLLTDSKSNEYKKSQAEVWLLQSGGQPTDWQKCCRKLCHDITSAVNLLIQKWTSVTGTAEDAKNGIEQLRNYVDRQWPAHHFDRLLEDAARELGLEGFDVVAYRTKRLPEWQEVPRLFSEPEYLEPALRRMIFQELSALFGSKPPPSATDLRPSHKLG